MAIARAPPSQGVSHHWMRPWIRKASRAVTPAMNRAMLGRSSFSKVFDRYPGGSRST